MEELKENYPQLKVELDDAKGEEEEANQAMETTRRLRVDIEPPSFRGEGGEENLAEGSSRSLASGEDT